MKLKFTRDYKYSPRGYDIRHVQPGEVITVPEHIAHHALSLGVADIYVDNTEDLKVDTVVDDNKMDTIEYRVKCRTCGEHFSSVSKFAKKCEACKGKK
jgi:hypothetical protein